MNLSTRNKSEVDLRVAQELKNNRDFIYETNQALQNLASGVKQLNWQLDSTIAKSDSDRKMLSIEFENLSANLLSRMHKVEQSVRDIVSKVDEAIASLEDFNDNIIRDFPSRKEMSTTIFNHASRLDYIAQTGMKKSDMIEGMIQDLKVSLSQDMTRLKSELTPDPKVLDPVYKQINERMAIWKVDFDGIVKEIQLLKNAIAYDQKKFEHLFTQIERLKERG